MKQDRFLGIPIRPVTRRRIQNFKANRRGYWSFWIFLALLAITLPAEFVANEKPLVVYFDGGLYFPVMRDYAETTFGGDLPTSAVYTDPFVVELIEEEG